MIETAAHFALWVDMGVGIAAAFLVLLILVDKTLRKVFDFYGAFSILYQYAVDRAGRKEAERKVKSRKTITEYKPVKP